MTNARLAQIVFSFFSLFSGSSAANSWIVLSYNVFLSGLPPLVLAIFEKDISEDLILRYPEAYCTQDRRHPLSPLSFLAAEVLGFAQV
jgi:magnesium-transporting ATPase (P-type)